MICYLAWIQVNGTTWVAGNDKNSIATVIASKSGYQPSAKQELCASSNKMASTSGELS